MIKRLITALLVGVAVVSPIRTQAEEEPELEYIRTTVYYAKEGAKTATGKEARYGIIAGILRTDLHPVYGRHGIHRGV